MTMKHALAALLLASTALAAEPVWIVGDDYVARFESKLALHQGVKPGSYGFDDEGCSVW